VTAANKMDCPVGLLVVRKLGRQPYEPVYAAMKAFVDARSSKTADEFWWLEHDPVYTLGQAGKPEHLLMPGDIPVVQSDRGGQVTYHGPGQAVGYALIDIKRLGMGARSLVTALENTMIACLAPLGIHGYARVDAPGVYVAGQDGQHLKIGSLGIRIRRGCAYHGLALNIDMDLEPFLRINPCGYSGLEMTQIRNLVTTQGMPTMDNLQAQMIAALVSALGYEQIQYGSSNTPFFPGDGDKNSSATMARVS